MEHDSHIERLMENPHFGGDLVSKNRISNRRV